MPIDASMCVFSFLTVVHFQHGRTSWDRDREKMGNRWRNCPLECRGRPSPWFATLPTLPTPPAAERLAERGCEAGATIMAGRGEKDTARLVDDVQAWIGIDSVLVDHRERWVDELRILHVARASEPDQIGLVCRPQVRSGAGFVVAAVRIGQNRPDADTLWGVGLGQLRRDRCLTLTDRAPHGEELQE